MGAVQLLCLGMLGEYVGRLYTQMQGRPSYFVASDSLESATPRRDADVRQVILDPPQAEAPLIQAEVVETQRLRRVAGPHR